MRLQDGIYPVRESFDRADSRMQTLGSSITPFTTNLVGEVSSWYYEAPPVEKKNRISLRSRLKTVNHVPRSASRPISISSLSVMEPSSHRGSSEWRNASTPLLLERSEKAARSILSRGGRILRWHGNKFSLSSIIMDEESEHGHLEVLETCQRPQQRTQHFRRTGKDLKRTISHPFDFHHVTHTQPQQFETLDRGSQNDLITEFIAIRAAQRPRSTLQGIQADDLCDSDRIKQSRTKVERHPRTVNTLRIHVDPLEFAASAPPSSRSPAFSKSIRSSPSIENFSRPTPWSPKSPTSPPPRTSSRSALHSPSLSLGLGRNSGERINGHEQPALDSDVAAGRSPLRLAHAITTVDDSARPLKTSPLPTPSADLISESVARAGSHQTHNVAAEIGSSTHFPLRHASSFPTANIASQHGHHHLSDPGQHATKARPDLSDPGRSNGWEDIVDYCYENAAEADCNFDWSQRTVYVDADHGLPVAQASDAQLGEKSSSSDEQPQSAENQASRPCPGAFHQPRFPSRFHLHSQYASKKSAVELGECLALFGRDQSSSQFSGYQHWPRACSKPIKKLHIISNDLCARQETASGKESGEYAELEMLGEHYSMSESYHSGGPSSWRAVRPLMHKYSSEGSMLSSTTSTIRTYRSSNSVGSVPDLIHSFEISRESAMVEKAFAADTVNNEMPHIPQHPSLAARRQVDPQPTTAERPRGRSQPQTKDTERRGLCSEPTVPAKLPELIHGLVGTHEKSTQAQAKTVLNTRERSASALTPGQCLATRASYSLFPPEHSLPRST